MTAVTAVPSKDKIAVELAACILASYQQVGKILAYQQPRIGHIDEQALAARMGCSAQWAQMVEPVARNMVALAPAGAATPDPVAYTENLRNRLGTEAGAGLYMAMELQLSRGQHPEVAWQRAVAGYGLDIPAMRAWITAATRVDKDGAMMTLSASKATAQLALLAHADKVGISEVEAWATLPVAPVAPVSKAGYEEDELRDVNGRWTATPRGKAQKAKVTERDTDAGLDAFLNSTPVDAPIDRYGGVPLDRYAAATPVDRYGSRYTEAPLDRYADAAVDRYGDGADRYGDGIDRYGAATPTTHHIIRHHYLLGAAAPNATPAEPAKDPDKWEMYLPARQLSLYFLDRVDIQRLHDRAGTSGAVLDFADIADYYTGSDGVVRPSEPIPAKSPWRAVEGFGDAGDAEWDAIKALAVPLWEDVQQDPWTALDQLGQTDLSDVAEFAGYPLMSGVDAKKLIADNLWMRDSGVHEMLASADNAAVHYDPGVLNAFADYVVWNEPGVMGDKGKALSALTSASLNGLSGQRIPEVFAFSSGLNPFDHAADLRSRYMVEKVQYHSAIHDFGYGMPNGVYAMREMHLVPEKDY